MEALMSIKTGILRVAAVAALVVAAPVARAETLAQALVSAYDNSGLLEQNRALLRVADEDVAIATANLQPIVNWSANAKHSWSDFVPAGDFLTATLQISGQLTIYDGGANRLAIESQKENVLGTRESLRGVEQQVLLRAIQAYMNVRRDTEFKALRESNVRVLTQEFRAAQDRFQVGEVTRTDVSFAEARLAAARSLLAAAEGNLARSKEEFRAAVGRAPGALTPAPVAPLARSVQDAKAYALQNHPNILQTQHSVAAAELSIQRAETAFGPSATLNGYASVNNDGNGMGEVGVTVSGPLYAGGRIDAQVRQIMARRDAARAGLHITAASVEQNVANAYANYSVAVAGRQAYEQQVAATRVAWEGVREEAALGSRTTLDVLNAEQELLNAQASLVSAQVDEVTASYAILASMGLLTAEHLRLPVQTYDPEAYYNLVQSAPRARSEQGQALDRVLEALGK